MKVKAIGLLRHHFWGQYCATIALEFATQAHASDALRVLGDAWSQHNISDNVLMFHGAKDALSEVEKVLIRYGADSRKLTSLAKSVDYGEIFQVEIPIVPKEQGKLNILA